MEYDSTLSTPAAREQPGQAPVLNSKLAPYLRVVDAVQGKDSGLSPTARYVAITIARRLGHDVDEGRHRQATFLSLRKVAELTGLSRRTITAAIRELQRGWSPARLPRGWSRHVNHKDRSSRRREYQRIAPPPIGKRSIRPFRIALGGTVRGRSFNCYEFELVE
jgi:hypothetical protein